MKTSRSYARVRWILAQYLEGKWWERYLRKKPADAYLADKAEYWRKTLDQLDWEPVAGRKVLDAGCGPAGIFIYLRNLETVTALDPLLGHYEAKLPIFSRAKYPEVTFIRQALEVPIGGRPKFDAIYCFNAINHVADWDESLDRLTQYAREGTRMILTSDVHRHRWLRPIFRALPGDALHPQQHSSEAYRKALRARGWVIEFEEILRKESIFNYTAWTLVYNPSNT